MFMAGVIRDVTEAHLAAAALKESEERLRLANEAGGIGTFTADLEADCVSYSPELAAMLSIPKGNTVRITDAFARVHPDDVAAAAATFQAGLSGAEGGRIRGDLRFLCPGGEVRWLAWTGRVAFCDGSTGRIPFRVAGACVDITERKQHEEQIKLLLAEVNHRAKNMLTVVQSIARQTAAASPEDFMERFAERIQALSASQDLLVKNEWRGVDLGDLVRSQLAHFKDLIGTRIELKGSPVLISASAAQTIGMALHELATNAGKYGALSTGAGRVEVAWSLDCAEKGTKSFTISWRETGGPSVTAPERSGFGSAIIGNLAEISLGAKVDLAFESGGLSWVLRCPAQEVLESARGAPGQS
jgi:two-component sensor histidine kinase